MNKTERIKVLLVDDHTLVRDAVAIMLKQVDDIQVVGALSSGEEAVNKVSSLAPEVILMDIMLKGMTGIEATRWIKERNNRIKIILLSMEVKREFVTAGIQSGIDGYLPKDVERHILLDAIRSVYKGGKYFNEAITSLVFEDFYKKEKSTLQAEQHFKVTDLTKREREVLALVANGINYSSVRRLWIHTKHIYLTSSG
jgi:DNA-binding NarL/FixJ family response regulator